MAGRHDRSKSPGVFRGLLVEQNVKLAFELADDVVILNTGRVAFAGKAADVRDDRALITQHLGVF